MQEQENKEDAKQRIRESQRAWAKRNPEKIKAHKAKYYANNKEKVAAYAKAFRQKKREILDAAKRQWEAENPEKVAMQRVRQRLRKLHGPLQDHLERRYSVSADSYEKIREMQKGVCLICGELRTNKKFKRLVVDHQHSNGLCRALLCYRCNVGLGFFSEQKWLFDRAARYLEVFNAVSDESDWASRVRRVLESLPPQSREEGCDEGVEETEPLC